MNERKKKEIWFRKKIYLYTYYVCYTLTSDILPDVYY